MPGSADRVRRHFTTRHSFAIFVGFLVLALYFMWAFYGAAPTSLRFLAEGQADNQHGASPSGHGSTAGGMKPEAFEELAFQFVEDFGLPDGSVRPTHRRTASAAATVESLGDREDESDEHRDAAGRGAPMAATEGHRESAGEDDAHGGATEPDEPSRESSSVAQAAVVHGNEEARAGDGGEEPIDVYLMALRYSYVPRVLRLEHGVPYRFRMMSMDVNHGASIHSGFTGHIMRRPAGTMVEMVMTFPERGEYMIYCTVYCGEGHSTMKGKIIVE